MFAERHCISTHLVFGGNFTPKDLATFSILTTRTLISSTDICQRWDQGLEFQFPAPTFSTELKSGQVRTCPNTKDPLERGIMFAGKTISPPRELGLCLNPPTTQSNEAL